MLNIEAENALYAKRCRDSWAELRREHPEMYRNTIALCEAQLGKYKKITYSPTGTTHAVPIETLVTQGLKGTDLLNFPLWDDAKHGTPPQ